MRELSLHLLDIIQNARQAGARTIRIALRADPGADTLRLLIADDGCGMAAELLSTVTDPFVTTRTTRKVGLGIPLLKELCEQTGGSLNLSSQPGCGTCLEAVLGLSHIDRLPLGSVSETIRLLVLDDPTIDYCLEMACPDQCRTLDLAEVRQKLDGVPLNEPTVLAWIGAFIDEQQAFIFGGILNEITR
jgi:hypothetical protein